jgi:hypothetical protein
MSRLITVAAREADDPQAFKLFGLSETGRAAILRLGKGDTAAFRGGLAARIEGGAVVLAINVQSCAMRLPITKKAPARPRAPKPGSCGRGTPHGHR